MLKREKAPHVHIDTKDYFLFTYLGCGYSSLRAMSIFKLRRLLN